MNENDTKGLSRLTAILTILQTKRLLTASQLSNKFSGVKAQKPIGAPIDFLLL